MPISVPTLLASGLAKPVAILGGGAGGDGVRLLVTALGADARIYDVNGAEFTLAAARTHALVVHGPGFPPSHPWLERARAAGAGCISELDLAALCWRGRLVAVTGTNGKTTLVTLLTHALHSIAREAYATGSAAEPFSRLVAEKRGGAKEAVAVCEVSSAQAEALRHFRADSTLWANVAEDHLDRHGSLEAYFSAKWNLVAHTAPGGLLAGTSVQRFAQKFDRPLAPASAVATEAQTADTRLARTVFAHYPQRENFLLAAAWWRTQGLEEAALVAAARSFRLARHRLTRVVDHDGVAFWNDSKATNFHAVEAALAGFAAPVVLIAGGRPKGGDLAGFVHRVAPRVKHVVLIGEASDELAFHCSTFRVAHTSCATLDEAVRRAADLAVAGDHVLLSPGFASFDMFRDFEDRGEQFERLARELAVVPASLK